MARGSCILCIVHVGVGVGFSRKKAVSSFINKRINIMINNSWRFYRINERGQGCSNFEIRIWKISSALVVFLFCFGRVVPFKCMHAILSAWETVIWRIYHTRFDERLSGLWGELLAYSNPSLVSMRIKIFKLLLDL